MEDQGSIAEPKKLSKEELAESMAELELEAAMDEFAEGVVRARNILI